MKGRNLSPENAAALPGRPAPAAGGGLGLPGARSSDPREEAGGRGARPSEPVCPCPPGPAPGPSAGRALCPAGRWPPSCAPLQKDSFEHWSGGPAAPLPFLGAVCSSQLNQSEAKMPWWWWGGAGVYRFDFPGAGGAPCLSSSVPQGPPGALQTRALEREEGAPRLRLLASPLPSPTAPSSSAACPRGAGASCTRLPSRRGPSKAPRCLGPRASRPLGLGGWQLASPDSGRANVQGAGRPSFLRPERVLFCPNPKVEFLNFQRSLFRLLAHAGSDKHRNGDRSLSGDPEPGDQGHDI